MAFQLTNPPEDERARELWLQHAAGFIMFQDIREYAIERIPENVTQNTRKKIIQGIDDAIYGLMMIMDGVSGSLDNDDYSVGIKSIIQLKKNDEIIQEIDTFHGDGMCMGYHGWQEGDFGDGEIYPVQEDEND
jgi:hypothetical protein